MRFFPRYNFDAFEKAAADLRRAGYDVISPAELDIAVGFNPDTDEATPEFVAHAMERDLAAIREIGSSGGIALLEGWQKSQGTLQEIDFATKCIGCRIATVQLWVCESPWTEK